MLLLRTSAIRFNGELSGWFDVKTGTVSAPQGDIEGRPIFNVGINWCTAMVEAFKVVSKGSPLQRGCAETKPVIPRRKAKKKAKPEANVMDVDCRV